MDKLKTLWTTQMVKSMMIMYPDTSEEDIQKYVNRIYDERMKDHKCQLYNNYENMVADSSLKEIVNWLEAKKPLIAESGVYFYQKSERRNVNVEIIKECMLDARSVHKKEMFKALDEGDVFTARIKNIQQANDKKAANSGYGAEGQSSSFLYNVHSAMSVTASGRGQISTACQCFENLFADSVKFFNNDEFFTWVNNIMAEEPLWKFSTDAVIDHYPTRKEFIKRFVSKFEPVTAADEDVIGAVYDYVSKEMAARIYYKANIREFLQNKAPMFMYADIASTDVPFIDPNKIPDKLKSDVDTLSDMVVEFVNYKYSVFRYEDRTRYQPRHVAVIID